MKQLNLLMLLLALGIAPAGSTTLDQANQAATAQDHTRAIALYQDYLNEQPDDGSAHYLLANVLMQVDRLELAASHYTRAGELGFQPQGVGYRLARIHARKGESEQALAALEAIASQITLPSIIENEADFDSIKATRFLAALETIRATRYPCKASDNHRAFDFWVGSWDVSVGGQAAGKNEIKLVSGDCVLFENWTGVSGTQGKSFNYYDAGEDHWRQVWIGDSGGVIEFTGQFEDGVLHYTATTRSPQGGAITQHKLDFYPNDDGSVRQHWQQSTDGGETWSPAFDGHYVRSSEAN